MFDWNDLRYFVAVARHKSTLAAGRALGLSQSTVQRRLVELERRIGHQLVRRHQSGYRLTDLGEAMLPFAIDVEAAVLAFQQNLGAAARAHGGIIRLTCPEPIVLRLTQSGLLGKFEQLNPGLSVEFVMSDRYIDLGAGDADVALRSGDTDDVDLVGLKIADSIWAIYGSRHYVEKNGGITSIEALADHRLIAFEEKLASHRVSKWLSQVAPHAEFAARSNSVLGLVNAAKSGVGLAPLPIALGDAEADLVCVLGPIEELTRAWRLLAHPDLRKTSRVSAFFDFIAQERNSLKPILTG